MQIRFADGSELKIRSIIGGPRRIQNADRDVLTIEVSPEEATLEELKTLFQDKTKTNSISSVSFIASLDNEGEPVKTEEINHIGDHYTIYLSSANVMQEKPAAPGIVAAPQMEEVNIVEIAQATYQEILLEQLLATQAIK